MTRVNFALLTAILLAAMVPVRARAKEEGSGPRPTWASSLAWTKPHLVIWGGRNRGGNPLTTAARYDPASDTWTPLRPDEHPAPQSPLNIQGGALLPIWTGEALISWPKDLEGGKNLFEPVSGRRQRIARPAFLRRRQEHYLFWSGERLILWGGYNRGYLDDGGLYDPASDTWRPITSSPLASAHHRGAGVWTGEEMILWGGRGKNRSPEGLRYDPRADRWRGLPEKDAPERGQSHLAVWTGREVIVWGGIGTRENRNVYFDTGSRFDPVANRWRPMSDRGAPIGRTHTTAVWTGTEMIVWGGYLGDQKHTATGSAYDPATDTWRSLSMEGAPAARREHEAVWTGDPAAVGRWINLPLLGGEPAVSGPARKPDRPAVEILDQEEYELLLGEHAFTLQWIGWKHPGKVRVEEREGQLRLSGGQEIRREESSLRINGRITRVASRAFTFVGRIEYRVTGLNQGRPCVRKGRMTFRRTGKRRFWRLAQMHNPCDGVTDYFDLFLRKGDEIGP